MAALLADGGELTVVRRLVNFVYGYWDVTWPEDFEPPELEPGLRLGYVGRLGEADPGLSARRFVREDVQIVATDSQVDPPELGVSNVEEIFDTTVRRASGDVFFERDITGQGLGLLEPLVDFRMGSLVPVRLWGRVLEDQMVTAIDQVSSPAEPVGWRVHIGGQIRGDAVERARQNRELVRAIAQERRERAKETGEAISTARTAAATATTAYSFAVNSRDQASQAVLEARQATEVAAQADLTSEEGKQTAIQALTTAASANTTAIQANSTAITANSNSLQALNRAQAADEEFKRQQLQINDQQRQINANQLWVNSMVARPLGAAAGYSDEDDYARLVVTSTNVEFASKKRWHGRVYLLVSFEALNNYTKVYAEPVYNGRPSFSMSSQAFQGVRDVFCMYKVFGEY